MWDQFSKAYDLEQKAEKKLDGWGPWGWFGSKYDDAVDLFHKAANEYKLAETWYKAGCTYTKLAHCYLKLDRKHEAAEAYVDAAHCFKRTSIDEAAGWLGGAVDLFCEIGSLTLAARYLKEIAEWYESEQNIGVAGVYYGKSACFYENEGRTTSANQCKQKVAQFAAQRGQYQKSIEIYEEIARQSLNNSLLKDGVKGHLLNAGICQLCEGDVIAIKNALERYQELDPTFSGTCEYRLLVDIAAAIDEEDVGKFTDVVKEFDSLTPLDSWNTALLSRVREKLKVKELVSLLCTGLHV